MPVQDREREIDKLEKELLALKEREAKADTEAHEWSKERNRLNAQAKSCRSKIRTLKVMRDGMNWKVRMLKLARNNIEDEIRHSRAQMRLLRQRAMVLADKEPQERLEALQGKVDQTEWSIQTESLSLDEEKELVDYVRQLQGQIDTHKKIELNRKNMLELQAELKAAETRRSSCHKELTTTADRSQEVHAEISETVMELNGIRTEATDVHKNFLLARDQVNVLRDKITSTFAQILSLRRAIKKEEELARSVKEAAMKEKARDQAKAKLNRGEKLTWHEFQIAADEGETTQD